jgi:hypothetical protein
MLKALAKLYLSAKALFNTSFYLQLKLEATQKINKSSFENKFSHFTVCVRDRGGILLCSGAE